MFREQGLNKFVKVTFPEFFLVEYIARDLENELGIKVNRYQYPTPTLEFIWSPEISLEVIVEIRLEQYKNVFFATIEFNETSDYPLSGCL